MLANEISLEQAIDNAIQSFADNVLELIRLGWTKDRAIEHQRSRSSLGPKSLTRAMLIINQGLPQ